MKEYSNDDGTTWEGPFSDDEIQALATAGVITTATIVQEYGRHTQMSKTAHQPEPVQQPQPLLVEEIRQQTTLPKIARKKRPAMKTTSGRAGKARMYYVSRPDGTKEGPMTEASLRYAYQAGVYHPQTLIYTESQGCWLPISRVMGYSGAPRQAVAGNEAFSNPFSAYFYALSNITCGGRARRAEIWMFCFGFFIITFIIGFFSALFSHGDEDVCNVIGGIWILANTPASIAITARRLHDIGMSGWVQLVALIPGFGQIILFVLCCVDSNRGNNGYGPSPKYPN